MLLFVMANFVCQHRNNFIGFQIVDQESGTYIHHLVTTLESDLISDLDLDISIVWDRVEDPQPAEDGTVPEQDDFQLIVGVSYEF